MSTERVYIVDDDADVRDATSFLIATAGYPTVPLPGPDELLESISPDNAGCLVLDVRLPGMDGLQLQQALKDKGIPLPIIFITGHGDIPMAVRAVNAGALDFLEKPLNDEDLLDRIATAMEHDRERRERDAASSEIEKRLAHLTPREREVMEGILAGKLSKVIAYELGSSVRTVEVQRARVLDKLGAHNGPEMVRLVLASPSYRNWSPE